MPQRNTPTTLYDAILQGRNHSDGMVMCNVPAEIRVSCNIAGRATRSCLGTLGALGGIGKKQLNKSGLKSIVINVFGSDEEWILAVMRAQHSRPPKGMLLWTPIFLVDKTWFTSCGCKRLVPGNERLHRCWGDNYPACKLVLKARC